MQCQSAKRLICMGIFPHWVEGSQIKILQTTQTSSLEDTLANQRKRQLSLADSTGRCNKLAEPFSRRFIV
jgi:hypothetical protein